ncbi:MAG TPA: aminomethyl-transferring glycine dehydrogenase subunit GcvPB [Candidatus Kapabacteria bacterium]|nr:aminomethyl-transferring glycine dehydrogenase subunit GcvPB [Candidatus Kapabacteria bacterium]
MESLIFEKSKPGRRGVSVPRLDVEAKKVEQLIPAGYLRQSPASLPEVSENEVVRHFTRLSTMNYHIDKGLYPLGSCTMKYNPKINEVVASLAGYRDAHPMTPDSLAQGALQVMYELGECLKGITGLQGVSLQPAAGAQGELTGILMVRAYHNAKGKPRHKILVPDSAHGTNPASAAIAGFTTVSVKSNEYGRVDVEDLKHDLDDEVAAFMVTNPNTLGIFEKDILEIQKAVHEAGALMYFDGANMNALLGIARPGDMGFDCVHINLHKTFSTPHGGGGPGSGPVCISERLIPYLPTPTIEKEGDRYFCNYNRPQSIGRLHGFFGNFGMHVRALTYILMHGKEHLPDISKNAIINANYLLSRLKPYFEYPYNETPMHEFVLSGDRQKAQGVKTLDIAKRLLDYGFHAPTIYFPLIVHEAIMIEPTETETKENLDAFADAMLAICKEIETDPDLVRNAPYTTPVRRLDDALAARKVNIAYKG